LDELNVLEKLHCGMPSNGMRTPYDHMPARPKEGKETFTSKKGLFTQAQSSRY